MKNSMESNNKKLSETQAMGCGFIVGGILTIGWLIESSVSNLSKQLNPQYKYYWHIIGFVGLVCAVSVALGIRRLPEPLTSKFKEEYRDNEKIFAYELVLSPIIMLEPLCP